MKGFSQFGMLFALIITILVAVALIGIITETVIISSAELLETTTGTATNSLETVKFAVSACSMWRAAPIFFDPAALCPGISEAVVATFPNSDCSADNPVACEAACACLLRLQKYCNIGTHGSGKSLCLNDPCRVQMGG